MVYEEKLHRYDMIQRFHPIMILSRGSLTGARVGHPRRARARPHESLTICCTRGGTKSAFYGSSKNRNKRSVYLPAACWED